MLHWEKANAVVSNANTILINYHMKEWCVIIQCDRGDADNFFSLMSMDVVYPLEPKSFAL